MISQIQHCYNRLTLLLVFLFSVISFAFPQNYIKKTFTIENGLSNNNVREIEYDSTGFLWVATWDGLNRYDGYGFKSYTHIPGDSTTVPFFSVRCLSIDGSDNLWVGSDNGEVSIFNRLTEKFSTLSRINGEKVPTIPSFDTDSNGDIWLISNKVIYHYKHRSAEFVKYNLKFPDGTAGFDYRSIYSVNHSGGKKLWFTGTTVYEMERNESEGTLIVSKIYDFQTSTLNPQKIIKNTDHMFWTRMYADNYGRKWFFSNYGLFLLNKDSGKIEEFTGALPLSSFRGKNLFCWGGISGGLYIYKPGTGSEIKISESSVNLLKCIACRDMNMIWYSSTSFMGNPLGLTRLILTPDYFTKYNVDTESDKLPAVYSVTVDNQKNVWLGIRGRDHIVIITPEKRIIKKYTPASGSPGYYGPVRSLKPVSDGIWIGYFYEMLLFYDYKTENFRQIKAGPYYLRALEVRDDGKLYIGNSRLVLFDPSTLKATNLSDSVPLGSNFRFTLEKNGTLWSGMSLGTIMRYIPSESRVTVFLQTGISNNVEDVCPGDNGEIWLAMLGGGLVRYNTITGIRNIYTTSHGLPNNTIYCILRDNSGNIWVSTDIGIARLNPSTGIIKIFGPSEGLDIVEFNSGASYRDENGRLFFGGMGGAISFHPDSINAAETDAVKREMILSGLTVSGNEKVLDLPVYKSDSIILGQGEDNFHLTMATTDFASSEKTDYRYRLTGHDKDWIVTNHLNRNINYINIHPGTYTLMTEATDRNGEWTTKRKVTIIVKPYFHQRAVFRILIVMTSLALFFFIVRLYLKNLHNKYRQIQDELRLQALRGQMNPHFIFNSLNSINYFISNNDKISANRYIADFSRLIRAILSNMGSDYVPFSVEMDSVKDYLEIEHLRFGDKFDYIIDVRGADELEYLQIFPGLIQPFIENAIWHGMRALSSRKGNIRIKVSMPVKTRMTCLIEDDGIGRTASRALQKNSNGHKSRGIGIVMERLQIISKLKGVDYRLEICDLYPGRNEPGTRVLIDIPLKIV